MKFYKQVMRTFVDLPSHHSLLIHSLVGCNMHCFGCHNYDEIVAKKHEEFFTEEDMIQQIQLNGYFFDAIIFSGGEFLLEKIEPIINFLNRIRSIFHGLIIINTNGTFPDKMRTLINQKLVDGFHIDMKLPYHLLDINEDKEIFQAIMGIEPTQHFLEKLLTSIEIVIQQNSPYSQIRTVKYPILSDEFFEEIEYYIKTLNQNYHTQVEYRINEFLDISHSKI
ncbi:4Fe-4S cluster-binding domain-containing protein [Tepidibacillus sp. HK-1]|uniref:4Fe-4S cluster-binding domain-containing protein n=1 Tax=Tepidibacillus sp. HK-1 TaxID=1883407 RepID=UPI00085392D5|nr:4Fe-4S cluster-binding domain-containing protein [Tepidibacillus sp. HK-1]GBF11202.1 7-carboxy-7-deazaguanine synthase [Tepidibacillus sp. HK-1]